MAIAGLGGIGSWVALYLAISRLAGKLELVDFDYVESHNLHRTPYRPEHICMLKAKALRNIIKEHAPEVEVTIYPYPLEKVIDRLESEVMVEATDSTMIQGLLHEWLRRERRLVTVHYDGESITIGVNLVPGAWEIGKPPTGYQTAPVYVATPAVAAALAVHILTWGNIIDGSLLFRSTLSDIVASGRRG
ncbi:MAG: ThiF family adenylyltransferase [Desulfurococcales archaeon]|nr:ThiF family adenylyltransferase [Desulfurococcales archaeon]